MTFLSSRVEKRLHQAFLENDLLIKAQSDCFLIKNSQSLTEEKVIKITESVGFCPLISKHKFHGDFLFTVSPYRIPDFFGLTQKIPGSYAEDPQASTEDPQTSSAVKNAPKSNVPYFNFDEISQLLKKFIFVNRDKDIVPIDIWEQVNKYRRFILPAMNTGLCELILPYAKGKYPIVEIGSGIGYSLPDSLSSRIIRVQPSFKECQLLSRSISAPIYQTDIKGLSGRLCEGKKKIPFFFALNVFDVISHEIRKTSLSQISQLQNIGDRILILLDTNPCLDVMIEYFKTLHPNCEIFPYFPFNCNKLRVVIVPVQHAPFKLSSEQFFEMVNKEAKLIESGHISETQREIYQLREKLNLKTIVLEDFFVEQIKKDLEQINYSVMIRYHASFSTGESPKEVPIKQDLVYKSVTDIATIRQWALDDPNLIDRLNKKGLKLPSHFNEPFLKDLREKGQKIFGAEFLVIEATKQ